MRALCFDTETSGLISNRLVKDNKLAEIFDFYGCIVDLSTDAPPEAELEQLFLPERPIPKEVTKITGMTTERLKELGAEKFFDHAVTIRDFIQSAPVVIAHNCSFDREMIQIELDRAGVGITWPRCICTVEQTLHLRGSRLKLETLHEMLIGHKHADAHRARSDAEALVRIARVLYQRGDLE